MNETKKNLEKLIELYMHYCNNIAGYHERSIYEQVIKDLKRLYESE